MPFKDIFGPVIKEMPFKDIYLELFWPLVLWRGTICAVIDKGIMRNISVNLF